MVMLSKKNDVVQREVAGEVFLVPIRGHLADLQELFVLNETGRWIWEHLDGPCRLDELAMRMIAEFDVDKTTACEDLEEFAQNLVEAGLAESTASES
jgi:hypothetical protein